MKNRSKIVFTRSGVSTPAPRATNEFAKPFRAIAEHSYKWVRCGLRALSAAVAGWVSGSRLATCETAGWQPALRGIANAAEAVGLVGVANLFSGQAEEWLQLTPPLGDYPHKKGLQRIDRQAVEAMANHFGSVRARFARGFGGVPFYIGHPDLPGMANEYPDRKAYGWVTEVEAKPEGLFGKVKWSEPGKELLANAHYKFFSPYWSAAEAVENGKRILRPVELRSVGLTNEPNLPVNALANEKGDQTAEEAENTKGTMQIATLIALLGLANEATEQQVTEKINSMKLLIANAATEKTTLEQQLATERTALANEKTAHGATATALGEERKAHNLVLVANAVKEGRITEAQRESWVADLQGNPAKRTDLANVKAGGLKTSGRTDGQGGRREDLANVQDRRGKVQELMQAKQASGLDYDTAWSAVQRERPELFAAN